MAQRTLKTLSFPLNVSPDICRRSGEMSILPTTDAWTASGAFILPSQWLAAAAPRNPAKPTPHYAAPEANPGPRALAAGLPANSLPRAIAAGARSTQEPTI
jgi:hypothetical protein